MTWTLHRTWVASVAAGSLIAALLASQSAAAGSVISAHPRAIVRVDATTQLRVERHHLRFGQNVTVNARLVEAGTGDGIGGEEVELQARRGGTDNWRQIATSQTAVGGRAPWTLKPDATIRYRVLHAATTEYSRALSPAREVAVSPLLSANLNKSWARQSGSAAVHGRVRPGFRGDPVVLQRRVDGAWHRVGSDNQNAEGRYRIRVGGWVHRGSYRYRVVIPATAEHTQAHSKRLSLDVVRLVSYQIETRGRIVASMRTFRERVAEIYADKRGWSRAHVHFKRLKSGADFSVVLAQAREVPKFAPVCDSYYSCRVGRYVIINEDRWRFGTPYFHSAGGTLQQYRAMVVDHETGHWFGLGHATCTNPGEPAPVMMQQSKGLHGCEPNPWPLPGEIARVR